MTAKIDTELIPLSHSQQNIWNLERAHPEIPLNNICTALRIDGNFQVDELQRCIAIAYETFPTLRTRITMKDGRPFQYVKDYVPETVPFLDFSKTNQSGVLSWYESAAKEHFTFYDSSLCQMIVFKLSENSGGILTRVHHIITDAWSHTLVTNQIIHNYFQFLQNKEPDTQIRPDYKIHIDTEEKYRSSKGMQRDKAYWSEKMKDILPGLAKEHQYAQLSPVGLRSSYRISNRLNRMIAAFCKENKVSPFAVFYMALAIYLRRIKGQERFCIGVPTINRLNYKEKTMGGMFVNTLPFVNKLDTSSSFGEFNEKLKEDWYELLYHQRLSFDEIKKLAAARNSAVNQIFGIVLSYQNGKMNHLRGAQVTLEGRWLYSGYQAENLCIHLSSRDEENKFLVDYDYVTQIFSQKDIDALHRHLMNILRAALLNPDTPIAELSLLTEEEEEELIFEFNETDTWYPREETIASVLKKRAEESPLRAAVIFAGLRVTYEQLIKEGEALLGPILGVCPEGKGTVAIVMERSTALFAALCGIILSENAWLLLDASLPENRLLELLKDSGAALCITDQKQRISGADIPVMTIEELRQLPAGDKQEDQQEGKKGLAYLVYTSGSTGRPKAVEIEQKSVLNLMQIMKPLYPKGAVLSICNVGFDAFLLESVIALLNGRTIVLAEEQACNQPANLGRLIQNYDVGFLAMTPSRLNTYLKDAKFRSAMAGIECIVCGGESLPAKLYQTLRFCTAARLYNQYGPSEAAVAVSHGIVSGSDIITIGKPLDNCRIYILDEYMYPMPVGAAGELYIGGECLARGYYNDPELTKEKFVPDPFVAGERLYATGDIGRWNEKGEIVFLGRKDQQLKLLGHRIEPAEIEAQMQRHPKVQHAAVKASGNQLIAFYTASCQVPGDEILSYTANFLPRYLVPVLACQVEELPLNTNGKVDYNRLSIPELPREEEFAKDETEEKLLEIWREELKNPKIGIHSDYFLSGGDSLNAVTMLARVEYVFHRMPEIQTLYTHSTVRRFANVLRETGRAQGEEAVRVPKAPTQETYPLSPAQSSFYVLEQMDETKLSYHMPGAFSLSESLDWERLLQAVKSLIAEDEMLRTAFEVTESKVVSRVYETVPFELEHIEADSVEEGMKQFIRPFHLAKPPLFRMGHLTASGRQYLLMDMHHILSDGISSALTMKRLDEHYRNTRSIRPALTYKDYAWWCGTSCKERLEKQRSYWKNLLEQELPTLHLPTDRPRKTVFDGKGFRYRFVLKEDTGKAVNEFCRRAQITPFMFLLSAYAVMLCAFSKDEGIIIGSPVSGRRYEELKEVTGVFVNTLPIILYPEKEKSLKIFIEEVKGAVLGMLENQEIPFEEMVALSGAERTREKNPLFQILFSLLPLNPESFQIGDTKLLPVETDSHAVKMDLHLEAWQLEDEYRFCFEYAQSLFDEVTIAFYSRCYLNIIEELIKKPEDSIASIKVLSQADYVELVERPNYIRTPYDNSFIDKSIDRMALWTPDETAVCWGEGKSYTYRDIKEKSDELASVLMKEGVGTGEPVAFLVKRDGDMLVTMTGILKAGGAYVPVDPAFPRERIAYMLEHAGVKILLCTEGIEIPAGILSRIIMLPVTGTVSYEPPAGRTTEDILNVIYTSGSTGKPKGVMMIHKSISNLLCHVEPLLGTKDDCILCASNCVFDVFTTETILALGCGRRISVASEEEMLLPWKMAERIQKDRVTVLQLTPSRIIMCLNDESFCQALREIRIIILLGEPWTLQLKEKIKSLTNAQIFNIYGPTETSVHNCQGEIRSENSIHIGKPIGNCRYYLLDSEQNPVLPTAIGEIYIAGECLAKGYINQQELTNQVFLPDILFDGEKMYKTGDIGRMRADGCWQCLGRVDTQLKLNGHRIEPAEIASCMVQSGMVKEAAVVPERKDGIPQFLKAFAVPNAGFSKDAMLSYLSQKLPDYMVPSVVIPLQEMPKSASGKIDLNQLSRIGTEGLPEPEEIQGPEETEVIDVIEEMEEKPESSTFFEEVWEEVLGHKPEPGVSFFKQGGTSLKAIVVLCQYYKRQYEFGMNDFYKMPVLEDQKAYLCGNGKSKERSAAQQKQTLCIEDLEEKADEGMKRTVPGRVPRIPGRTRTGGTVLLTGATGYLGIHLLQELLNGFARDVVCLVRGDAVCKIKETVNYYLEDGFYERNAHRIRAVSGDITKAYMGLHKEAYDTLAGQIDVIVHAAADVRHFAPEEELMSANVNGTRQAIALAKAAGAALMHISTVSVAGEYLTDSPKERVIYTEHDLNIGQNYMENPYAKSKTYAEAEVVTAMEEGVPARIFRVGRLTARAWDGVFQKNRDTNAFYRMIKGMIELGKLPLELKEMPIEVTSVDLCAMGIVKLMQETGGALHMMNPKYAAIASLLEGFPVEYTAREVFEEHLCRAAAKGESPYIQAAAEAYFSREFGEHRIHMTCEYTEELLSRTGFYWPEPNIYQTMKCFMEDET